MLTLKMPRKMSCAKEPDSRSTITMNRIQQEVMHAVHDVPKDGFYLNNNVSRSSYTIIEVLISYLFNLLYFLFLVDRINSSCDLTHDG